MDKKYIQDTVLLGDWKETQNIPVDTLRRWSDNPDDLDGLIIKGYEMKWGEVNENGELYAETAFDAFIQRYFVDGKFNMPVTLEHGDNWDDVCGRVLYIERNSVGFYFVVYIPKWYAHYEQVKNMLRDGMLQGFSKEGWIVDGEPHYTADWEFDYFEIKEIQMTKISLVSTPACRQPFEALKETKNSLRYYIEELKKQKPDKAGDFA